MSKFEPGRTVYVVNRDEDGEAYDVTGFLFLAEVAGAVIVTPRIFGCDTLARIMKYHVGETAKDFGLDLGVFPAEDCYLYSFEAEEALDEEVED